MKKKAIAILAVMVMAIAVAVPASALFGGLATQWGASGDVAAPADYNGDGTTDVAVFRPSDRSWYVKPSASFPAGLATQWGEVGDLPVPADFDGDGADEVAVFRPSTAEWFSKSGYSTQWGIAGDVPVPDDYDGDGDDDIAVFRPSTGEWFVKPDETVSFLAFGDAGTRNANQARVANQMATYTANRDLDAYMEAGDNVYTIGEPQYFQASLVTPYGTLNARGVPFWVALGNHDTNTNESWADQQLAFLGLPGQWFYEKKIVQGSVSVQFLFLDSNQGYGDQSIADQNAWLDAKLDEGDFDRRVVIFHHPPINCGNGHSPNGTVNSNWVPLMNGRADLVVTGHEHNYQRFSTPSGTDYIVTGGGGQSTYSLNGSCTTSNGGTLQKAQEVRHFVYVSVSDDAMTLTAVDENGNQIEAVTL